MSIKMIFLDLNGTIIDDWPSNKYAMQAVFHAFGVPCPSLEDFIRHVANTGNYISFYHAHGLAHVDREDISSIYLPAYHEHDSGVRLTPHVRYALKVFRSIGTEVHILTAARRELAEHLIEQVGIREYCEDVHLHVHNKAAQVKAVIDGMPLQPHECLMMGDLPADVLSAKEAGIHGVGYLSEHVPRDVFAGVTDMDFATTSFLGLLTYVREQLTPWP